MQGPEAIYQKIDLSNIRTELEAQRFFRRSRLKILIVTDSRFDQTNSVYKHLRSASIGCTALDVHRAIYVSGIPLTVDNNPAADEPHYNGFQFRSDKPDGGGKILDDYHVVFLFAVNTSSNFIDDGEIAEVHRWMDAGGGIFATGDHSTLGQRIASKIPRVGTMRKWTEDDEVPPGGGINRLDTNQPDPSNAGQTGGTASIPNSAQADQYPQPITWLPVRTQRLSWFAVLHYPHELLCHPTLGPIDVMPDHPHEGECVTPTDIDYRAKVKYGPAREYPTLNGHQERPRIIATGQTSSRYLLEKGDVNDKKFNMISVYDGHRSGVGRVVVDSTWHHWHEMNIDGLIGAGGDNWSKIGRYFLNVARYLSPPGVFREQCWWNVIAAQFDYPFVEEFVLERESHNLLESGRILGEGLRRRWGPCGELDFVIRLVERTRPYIGEILQKEIFLTWPPDKPPTGPVCLTCPPFDAIRAAVLGGVVRGTAPIREKLSKIFFEDERVKGSFSFEEIEELALKGVENALEELTKMIQKDLELSGKSWERK